MTSSTLPGSSAAVRLPPEHVADGPTWALRGRAILSVRMRNAPTLPADSMTTCHLRLAERRARFSRSVEFHDDRMLYVVQAEWEESPGAWVSILGIAADSGGQEELITVLFSLKDLQ